MKLRILNILIWNLFVFLILNCSIGTRTDACKADLRRATVLEPSDDSCEFLQTTAALPLPSNATEDVIQSRTTRISFLILNCYQYYTKLKECEKEGNRYTPALYSRE
ncbi:hypothetical protein [Leptospira interrogans]|uniref:Uncharacterized protein n=1 Tax=Leptospira interrogans serovar Bataviae TaxID=312175 RepID=A0AAQ0B561_LEPIR|nr:hypothetical protein [Leptospira interrogans]QOI53239.1 hypothetical protein Lepto1489_23100 [Leptospira interrogans serovar Bataviae]